MRSIFAAIVLAFAVHAGAQTQVSSVQGRVVRWGTSDPVAKASVELRPAGAGNPAPYLATTTADGAFVFANVPAGQYRIVASRPGYVSAEYGQRWPNGAGTPIVLPPGQAVSNVPIPMLQTGTISGVVRDALGVPLGNAEVEAFKATYQTGRRVLTKMTSTVSDDRGEYRLFWLTPGKYFVAARHAELSNSPIRVGGVEMRGGGGRGGPGAGGPIRYQQFKTGGDNAASSPPFMDPRAPAKEKYMTVYYPSTTDETAAAAIDVTPGGEARAIDFTVTPVQMRRVRGRVVYESNNEPAMSARVQFITSSGTSPNDSDTFMGPLNAATAVECCDGAFEIGLAPGSYTLVAAVNTLSARVPLAVGDSDVDGVVLAIGRSFNLRGHVTVEGTQVPPADLESLRFRLGLDPPVAGLLPLTYSSVLPTSAVNFQAGRGDFRISVDPFLPVPGGIPLPMPPLNLPASLKDAYVKSIRLGDADVLNGGLHLDAEPQQTLEIVISTVTGALQGRVINSDGQPVPNVIVALVPDAARRHRIDLIKSTSSDSSGRFRIDRIPLGDYVVFAFDGVADGEWQDPEYLAARESRGTAVKIGAGAAVSVELKALTE